MCFVRIPFLKRLFLLFLILVGGLICTLNARAQLPDKTTTAKDRLIDPLKMMNGRSVNNSKQWKPRRLELLALYAREMYGQSPGKPANLVFKVFDNDPKALNGKATRKQVTVYFSGKMDGPSMEILIYLPNQMKGPVPLFIGLNFMGNHAVINDPAVKITKSWVSSDRLGVIDHRATEKSRGSNTEEWPIEMILKSGYGFATIYCGDIDPDFDDQFKNGIHALYPDLRQKGDNFSTMAAWAWGLSRGMDYLQTDKDINPKQVGVFGFSRLGKAALWAGATDTRFNMVISNESGKGGAALFSRQKGETIEHLNTSFPHWFCENFKKYTNHGTDLPFDQHLLLSLIAPRLLYVASAEGDQYSDPEGEFLGAQAANPVYRLLNTKGLTAMEFPAIGKAVLNGQIGYHIRKGNHGVTIYDWTQYLKFADLNWKN